MSVNDWKVILNGSVMCGGNCEDEDPDACLKVPPSGTGAPALRTEDVTYPQRDGVEHFSDWYEPRILTFDALIGDSTSCGCSGSARERSRNLVRSWARACEDDELVLFTGCGSNGENLILNPSMTVNADNWTSTFNLTLTRSTTISRSGPASLRGALGALGGFGFRSNSFNVDPGVTYLARGYARAGTSTATMWFLLIFLDSNGDQILPSVEGPHVPDTTTDWTELTVSSLAPAGAVTAYLQVQSTNAAGPGSFHYFDDFAVVNAGGVTDGPFGVRGRARVVDPVWRRGRKAIADAILRFDAVDERLYVLDAFGTPGSGTVCSTATSTPETPGSSYAAVVAGQDVDHHYPLDSLHLTDTLAEDVIGSDDIQAPGLASGGGSTVPNIAAPISPTLGVSSIDKRAQPRIFNQWTGSYGSGMVGWWQVTDEDSTVPGVTFSLGNTHWIGADPADPFGETRSKIRWGGSEIALGSNVDKALGFTSDFRGDAVFVIVTWNASNVWVTVMVPDGSGGFNQFTDVNTAVGGLPAPTLTARLRVTGGRMSNLISGVGSYTTVSAGRDIATALAAGFADQGNSIVIPDIGDLCGPVQVTFTGSTVAPTLTKADGTEFVGTSFVGSETVIDTDEGTSTWGGSTDGVAQITGNPFMQVAPGEVLYAFGGGDVTVCFRPSVLSA